MSKLDRRRWILRRFTSEKPLFALEGCADIQDEVRSLVGSACFKYVECVGGVGCVGSVRDRIGFSLSSANLLRRNPLGRTLGKEGGKKYSKSIDSADIQNPGGGGAGRRILLWMPRNRVVGRIGPGCFFFPLFFRLLAGRRPSQKACTHLF